MQLKHPEQRGMGGQVEIRNNIKIRIPVCHANMVRPEHKSYNTSTPSGTILNVSKGIAGRSKGQNITCDYTISVETWKSIFRFEFKIWVIRICFEFRASSFEFYEKIIEQNMILIKTVTSINYEALSGEEF